MNARKKFEILIDRAVEDSTPGVDVTAGVMATLASRRRKEAFISERPMMWVAAISSAGAVPAAMAAVLVYYSWGGPMTELMDSISWVTQ